jgi:hypothetical protein
MESKFDRALTSMQKFVENYIYCARYPKKFTIESPTSSQRNMNDSRLSPLNINNDGYKRGFIITKSILWDNMCLSIIHDKYFFNKKPAMSMTGGTQTIIIRYSL